MSVTQSDILDVYSCKLFDNFPKLGLSLDAIMVGLLHDNLWQKTGGSGLLLVKSFVSYHDTDCTASPLLYMRLNYPCESHQPLCIVLQSTRLQIIG